MKLYSYIITRDYGFAPNLFYNVCTLATCKPKIRISAQVGDIVVGIGSASSIYKNHIIYAMVVNEKITYDEYWNSERFGCKKPYMYGSKKKMYGDNIYHKSEETGEFIQEDSHHSLEGGAINILNYDRDLSGKYVLIADEYWYWWREATELPTQFLNLANIGIGHRTFEGSLAQEFLCWLRSLDTGQYIADPILFARPFERYNGE